MFSYVCTWMIPVLIRPHINNGHQHTLSAGLHHQSLSKGTNKHPVSTTWYTKIYMGNHQLKARVYWCSLSIWRWPMVIKTPYMSRLWWLCLVCQTPGPGSDPWPRGTCLARQGMFHTFMALNSSSLLLISCEWMFTVVWTIQGHVVRQPHGCRALVSSIFLSH